MKTKKHIIVILSLLVIFSLPTYAHFLEEDSLGLSPESPIPIYSVEDLHRIGNNEEWTLDKHYKMMNDIAFEYPEEGQSNWTPIGDKDNWFTGSFDGNGKTIDGIVMCNFQEITAGLIYILYGGTIKNVKIINTTINCPRGTGAGGFVYRNMGIIDNCYFNGTIIAPEGSTNGLGGIAIGNDGLIKNSGSSGNLQGGYQSAGIVCINFSIVEDCYSIMNIIKSENAGGIATFMFSSNTDLGYGDICIIRRCFSTGTIEGSNLAGGIVCDISSDNSLIQDCYSVSDVRGGSYYGVCLGGIVGFASGNFIIERCYFNGTIISDVRTTRQFAIGSIISICNEGGFIQNCVYVRTGMGIVGNPNATIKQLNNASISSAKGTRTTKNLYEQAGWDFSSESPVWWFDEDTGFPQLVGVGKS